MHNTLYPIKADHGAIAAELRANRQKAGVKPSELDQAAYCWESACNYRWLNDQAIESAKRQHAKAVAEAAARKAQPATA